MAEAVTSAMLTHRFLHRLARQVPDQGVVHDLPIAREHLDRAEPEILGTIERKDDVAVDIVAMGAKLRRLGLLENDVGGAEILLEGGVIGHRIELRRVGGNPFRLARCHPGLQHGNLGSRRRLRP
jgi:hypothetical protein